MGRPGLSPCETAITTGVLVMDRNATRPLRVRNSPTMRYLADRERVLGVGGRRWLASRLLRACDGSLDKAVAVLRETAWEES